MPSPTATPADQPRPDIVARRTAVEVGTPVTFDITLAASADSGSGTRLVVRHLGVPVSTAAVDGPGAFELDGLPAGGYDVELVVDEHPVARGAFSVVDPDAPDGLMLYGFVADFRTGRDVAAVIDNVKRLQLTHVQFYDWAYRHADLLGGGEEYADALGSPVSLPVVRDLCRGLADAGVAAIGYAAVYGVGAEEWPRWRHCGLYRPDGEPYTLGDFLSIVDPAADDWLHHFTDDLTAAAAVGFDGFHLDQYGYPRVAVDVEGRAVDVAASFGTMLDAVRARLPDATLIFNNVNDFATAVSARRPQDAIYIEVWPPHTTLAALAGVVTKAKAAAPSLPVVIAAYQSVYRDVGDDVAAADRATALTMATLFSHGATQLLAGEADRVLVDPYYVRNHVAAPSTQAMLGRWYSFAVAHRELLFGTPPPSDVTGAWTGTFNDALDVSFANVAVSPDAVAGTVWRRLVELPDHRPGELVMHLVNLTGQDDTEWDAPRRPLGRPGAGLLRMRRVGAALPVVRCADPDGSGRLVEVAVAPSADGLWAEALLPELVVWQLVTIALAP